MTAVALVGIAPADAVEAPPRAGITLVQANDELGDARVTEEPGIAEAERTTIDIAQLRVTDRGNRVRFNVRMDRVDRTDAYTQLFLIKLRTSEFPVSEAMVATHSRTDTPDEHGVEHRMTIEFAEGDASCEHLPVKLKTGASRWWVEIPRRCIPRGDVKIEVITQILAYIESDRFEHLQSHDRLKVPGRHALGGKARPEND